MPYTPPQSDEIQFDLESFTPPDSSELEFTLDDELEAQDEIIMLHSL